MQALYSIGNWTCNRCNRSHGVEKSPHILMIKCENAPIIERECICGNVQLDELEPCSLPEIQEREAIRKEAKERVQQETSNMPLEGILAYHFHCAINQETCAITFSHDEIKAYHNKHYKWTETNKGQNTDSYARLIANNLLNRRAVLTKKYIAHPEQEAENE